MEDLKTSEQKLIDSNFRELNLKNCTNCDNYIWWSKRNQGCKEHNGLFCLDENTICDKYKRT